MYKQRMSYADYVEEVEKIYKIERRETYFGFIIRDFIQLILTESEQLVAVWDNKGYKDDAKNPYHKRKNYADSHSLQDFIIVSEQYDYTNTTKPYVSIELKRPDLEKYEGLGLNNNKEQIVAEFEYCDFIILTDCVTWIFLKKDEHIEDGKVVCLMQDGKWLQMEQRDCDNERMGNIYMREPEQWNVLVNMIRTFVTKAKKSNMLEADAGADGNGKGQRERHGCPM